MPPSPFCGSVGPSCTEPRTAKTVRCAGTNGIVRHPGSRAPSGVRPSSRRRDFRHHLLRISRIDVLVVDDWAMAPLPESERRDFWEFCGERCQTRSVILTSQMTAARWYEQIGDPRVADGDP